MTSMVGKVLLTLCLTVFGGGMVANAQIDSLTRIQADIPFAFTVGDTTLSPGKYEIRRIEDLAQNVLEISSVDSRARVIFDATPTETRNTQVSEKTELVFNKFGDQYFLSQIWVAGSNTGNELPKSRMEGRLTGANPEKHSLAAYLKRMKP